MLRELGSCINGFVFASTVGPAPSYTYIDNLTSYILVNNSRGKDIHQKCISSELLGVESIEEYRPHLFETKACLIAG
jgi:hypothetical protein